MARNIDKLSALRISRKMAPGMHGDGNGLWLQVGKSGSKSWVFRFSLSKVSRAMGLGSLNAISLAEARAMATDCRKLLTRGIDPIEARNGERQATMEAAAKSATYKYLLSKTPGSEEAKRILAKEKYRASGRRGTYGTTHRVTNFA